MDAPPRLRKSVVYKEAVTALRRAGVENPPLDAAVLLGHVTGEQTAAVLMDRQAAITPSERDAYISLVRMRCGRKAVSRIVGEREFYSRAFLVSDDVLDPRPETETLVEETLRFLAGWKGDLSILDIGTGSGAIAVTLACHLPGARITATDISAAALAVARQNAARHKVSQQVAFIQTDLLTGIRGKARFQAILSNPPYIPDSLYRDLQAEVREGDPYIALVPGPEGTEFYPPLARGAMELLEAGGSLLVEVGAGQAKSVADIFSGAGLGDVRVADDLSGTGRVVRGLKIHA